MRLTLLWLALASALAQDLVPGSRIPNFEAPDQNGNLRTFESIRGPKGAILLFHRSADW